MRKITGLKIGCYVFIFITLLFTLGVVINHAENSEHSRHTELRGLSYRVCDDYGCSEVTKELHWPLVEREYATRYMLKKIQELHPPKKENEDERIRNSKDIEEH